MVNPAKIQRDITSRLTLGADPSHINEKIKQEAQSRYCSPDGRNYNDHIPVRSW